MKASTAYPFSQDVWTESPDLLLGLSQPLQRSDLTSCVCALTLSYIYEASNSVEGLFTVFHGGLCHLGIHLIQSVLAVRIQLLGFGVPAHAEEELSDTLNIYLEPVRVQGLLRLKCVISVPRVSQQNGKNTESCQTDFTKHFSCMLLVEQMLLVCYVSHAVC